MNNNSIRRFNHLAKKLNQTTEKQNSPTSNFNNPLSSINLELLVKTLEDFISNFQKKITYNNIKAFILPKTHSDKIKNGITYRLWSNPFKVYQIYPICPHSILIENLSFKDSLNIALKHFKVKKKKNLIWKKVYYKKPIKQNGIQPKTDGYKFYYHKDDNAFLSYLLSQDSQNNFVTYFDIKSDRTGAYVKIAHNLYNKNTTYKFIEKKFQSLNIDYNDSLIKETVNKKGHWVKVKEPSKDISDNSKITITLSDDLFTAYAIKTPPVRLGRKIDYQDVKETLKKYHIVKGINNKLINQFITNNTYNQPEPIAVVNAQENDIHLLYTEEYLSKDKVSDKKYNIDNLFFTVNQDDIILKRIIPIGETPKLINVLGEAHSININEDEFMVAGENTYFDKKGNLCASISGTLINNNNSFTVHEVLRLEQVNVKTGNINHKGSIVIEQDIEDGMTVKADGSIFVKGNIGAANVEASGNIAVQNGIFGAYKAVIKSIEGSISSKFIRNSTIYCKKNLIVRKFLNDCRAWVNGTIQTDKNRGIILGGEFYVYKGITSGHIGSTAGWKTIIYLGSSIEIMHQIDKIDHKISELEKELEESKLNLKALLQYQKKEQQRLHDEILLIEDELKELNQEKESLDIEKRKIYSDAEIKVFGNMHSGVTINVGELIWENKFISSSISITIRDSRFSVKKIK